VSTVPTKFGEARVGASSTSAGLRGRYIAGFLALCVLGAVGAIYPEAALGIFAALLALGALLWIMAFLRRKGLEVWQGILLLALTGYCLLNYGFENIAVHVAGIPIIISYGLMYTAFALAMYSCRRWLPAVMTEPAMLCLFALLFLTMLHQLHDVPAYGLWAIRDSTMFLDGIFLFLGMFWATRMTSVTVLIKWLMLIIVINLFYSYTFPWSPQVLEWSPTSGVFQDVAIIGQYHTTDIYLLLGAIFCLGLGGYLMNRRRWILWTMVVMQMLGLAIVQARASYVALAAFIVILTVIGERKKSGFLVGLLISALLVLALATGVAGLDLPGRIGPVNISFLVDHLRSITGEKVTAASSVEGRVEWTDEALAHFRTSPIFGVGFGQPLIDYIDDETGAVVRFPHNSNITILCRLGVVGFLFWVLFHLCLIQRFIYAFWRRKTYDKQVYELILWVFLFYVMFMIAALVEAPFEFPSSAIQFYFFMGVGLGLARWQIPHPGREPQFAPSAPALPARA
jgi:O-antigen ligase